MSDIVLDMALWYPFVEEPTYTVLISRSVTGKEQRRLLNTATVRRFKVNFGIMERSAKDSLDAFYHARYGEYDPFYFPNNNDRVTGEYIGDRLATETYTLTSYPSGNLHVWDDSGVLVDTSHYTVDKITGVITFLVDVTNAYVSYDPCIYVRFDGTVEFEEFRNRKFKADVALIEVL